MNDCKYNEKYCVCISCEKEYGTNKEKCSIYKCEDCELDSIGGHGLGWCRRYWEICRYPQMSLFREEL